MEGDRESERETATCRELWSPHNERKRESERERKREGGRQAGRQVGGEKERERERERDLKRAVVAPRVAGHVHQAGAVLLLGACGSGLRV